MCILGAVLSMTPSVLDPESPFKFLLVNKESDFIKPSLNLSSLTTQPRNLIIDFALELLKVSHTFFVTTSLCNLLRLLLLIEQLAYFGVEATQYIEQLFVFVLLV